MTTSFPTSIKVDSTASCLTVDLLSPSDADEEMIELYQPNHQSIRNAHLKLLGLATIEQYKVLEAIEKKEVSQPVYLYLCEILHRILPTIYLTEADEIPRVPLSSLKEFIEELKKGDDAWWQNCWKENPNFIDLELGKFLFSHAFELLKRFLNHFSDPTLSFVDFVKGNFGNPRFASEQLAYDYRFYRYVIQHQKKMEIPEIEKLVDLLNQNLIYKEKGVLDHVHDQGNLLPHLINYRLSHPRASAGEARLAMDPERTCLVVETLADMGDMIFSFDHVSLRQPFFEFEICILCDAIRENNPFLSHKVTIMVILRYLEQHTAFSSEDKQTLETNATFFYKLWWYTAHMRSSSATTVYDLALKWQTIDFMIDQNGSLYSQNDAMTILRHEMERSYPAYPFNSPRAMSLLFSLSKKRYPEFDIRECEPFFNEVRRRILTKMRYSQVDQYLFGSASKRVISIMTACHHDKGKLFTALNLELNGSLQKKFMAAIFGLHDMIFAFNHAVLEKPYFNLVIIPLCNQMQEKFPFCGHQLAIETLALTLLKEANFKHLNEQALTRVATNFYKTWWYTTRECSKIASLYDIAIEWETIALFVDQRTNVVSEKEAIQLLEKQMKKVYPDYPFNSVYATAFVSYFLTKKRAHIYNLEIAKAIAHLKDTNDDVTYGCLIERANHFKTRDNYPSEHSITESLSPKDQEVLESFLKNIQTRILILYPLFPFDRTIAFREILNYLNQTQVTSTYTEV